MGGTTCKAHRRKEELAIPCPSALKAAGWEEGGRRKFFSIGGEGSLLTGKAGATNRTFRSGHAYFNEREGGREKR